MDRRLEKRHTDKGMTNQNAGLWEVLRVGLYRIHDTRIFLDQDGEVEIVQALGTNKSKS